MNTHTSNATIIWQAAATVTGYTQTHHRSAPTAHAWINTLHARAQIRAERGLRSTPH